MDELELRGRKIAGMPEEKGEKRWMCFEREGGVGWRGERIDIGTPICAIYLIDLMKDIGRSRGRGEEGKKANKSHILPSMRSAMLLHKSL